MKVIIERDTDRGIVTDVCWTKDGRHMRVVAVSHGGKVAVRPWERGDGRGARWVPAASLLGERPDSWERLWEDAGKPLESYWRCVGAGCSSCPCKVDGMTPADRYSTAYCHKAMQLDIVARAQRLAGQGE